MNNIIFFNHYHNGDIHLSRGLVRKVIEKVSQINPDTNLCYTHRNNSGLLGDIDKLQYTNQLAPLSDHAGIIVQGDTIYFNTWYGQQHYKYMNNYGITFDCLYSIFDDGCKRLWNFSLDDISKDVSSFFPIIDYSKFYIQQAQTWLDNNKQSKIFVSNGAALSGQAINFPFTQIIIDIALKHPDKIFILSNTDPPLMSRDTYEPYVIKHYKYLPEPHKLPDNVVYSSQIINKKTGRDLNENAFIASHCDVIIGRASGTFSFSQTQDNLFQKPTKFICFSNLIPNVPNKFWLNNLLKDRVQYSAKFLVHNEWVSAKVANIIQNELKHD